MLLKLDSGQLAIDDALEMTSSADVSKQTVGIPVLCVLNIVNFVVKRNVLGGNQVRCKYKKNERCKSLTAFIYFLYTFLALDFLPRRSSVFVTGNWTRNGRRQF